MPDITLGEMLTLLFDDLAASVALTDDKTGVKLQVTSLDMDLPASLRLEEARSPGSEPRLLVSLPSAREATSSARLGRIALTLGVEHARSPTTDQTPAPEKP